MATQAKVIIKGQNNIGQATKSAANDLSALKNTVSKFGSTLKSAFAVTAAIAAIQKLGSACKTALTEDFGEANRAYKQLAIALGDTAAYNSVLETVDTLAKKTLTANGDIEEMVAELAALGKSSDEINSISTAAVSLSNVTGKDLKSSMTTLLNTFNGTTTQLERLGVNLDGVTKEELSQGAAIDLVIEKLGDYSDKMAEEDSNQHLKNMSETWGDIKEKIGGVIDFNFGPWIAKLDTGFEDLGQRINKITIYVGAAIKNFPKVFSLTLSTLWEMVKKTFEWNSIKTIFITAIKNIGILVMEMLKAVFGAIPQMLTQLVAGILNWVVYIAANIESSFLNAIQSVINSTGAKIQGTWIGKIFKLGDKLESIDFGGDAIRERAESSKALADKSFENIGPILKDYVLSAVDSAKVINSNNVSAISDIYGGIGDDFKTALNEIVMPDLEVIKKHSDAADQSEVLEEIAENTSSTNSDGNSTTSTTTDKEESTIRDKISTSLSDKVSTVFTSLFQGTGSSLFTAITNEMLGGVGSLVSAIMPLVDIVMQVVNPLNILLTIIGGFVSVMEPALNAVFAPLIDVFTWIGEAIASTTLPLLDELHKVFSVIANVIFAVLSPIIQSLEPLFLVLSGVIEALLPILLLVAKAFTILMSPVQFLADLFSWLGSWIKYLGEAIGVTIYNLSHPFSSKKSYGSIPGKFTSDAFSGLSDRLSAIDSFSNQDTTATDSVATNTAVSSAGYQGGTQVTINIYQQAPIVGDGGMRAFAIMIKNQFEELNYYGVSV